MRMAKGEGSKSVYKTPAVKAALDFIESQKGESSLPVLSFTDIVSAALAWFLTQPDDVKAECIARARTYDLRQILDTPRTKADSVDSAASAAVDEIRAKRAEKQHSKTGAGRPRVTRPRRK